MQQRIRYITTGDGTRLAWAAAGRGPPLVRAATWLTHLQYDLESPVWAHWIRFLAAHFTCVRYDERGCGLSDWRALDLSPSCWLGDLEAVVEAAAIEQPMVLLGISQGASVAIRYAVAHPERVSHLILYGGYAVGGNRSDDPLRRTMYKAVMDVVGLGWGQDNPAFRQLFTTRFVPEGSAEQFAWFNELCLRTTSPENAVRLLAARGDVDVSDLLEQVRVPTLVLQCDRDEIAPPAQGRLLASRIPGATYIELHSRNHVLLEHEPAWHEFQEAVLEFTGLARQDSDLSAEGLTARERAALALLCEGRSNAQIAWALGIAEKTVRNHVSNLYRKLGVHSRAEAIVRTRP